MFLVPLPPMRYPAAPLRALFWLAEGAFFPGGEVSFLLVLLVVAVGGAGPALPVARFMVPGRPVGGGGSFMGRPSALWLQVTSFAEVGAPVPGLAEGL